MSLALIDGDILLYRVCWGKKDDGWEDVVEALDWNMQHILDRCQTRQYVLILSGSGNFRKVLYKLYKANRPEEKPPFFHEAKEYLITKWNAKLTTDCEADDELAILHSEGNQTTLCSIDKDFLQIPGMHYNWIRDTFTEVTEEMGMHSFYLQMLTGDTADNVPGIAGIGPVRGKRALFDKTTEEREVTVRGFYQEHDMDYELNKKLLWLPRTRASLELLLEEAHQLSISERLMEKQSEEVESLTSEAG